MKKLFFTHATRLLLAFLCIVTGFSHANADVTVFLLGSSPKVMVTSHNGTCTGTASGTAFSSYTATYGTAFTKTVTASDGKTWYYEVFKGLSSINIVFNNGSWNGGNQTDDLSNVSGTKYYYVKNGVYLDFTSLKSTYSSAMPSYYCFGQNNSSWSSFYYYTWNSETQGGWPGSAGSKVGTNHENGKDIYFCPITGSTAPGNIKWNGNSSPESSNQTFSNGSFYWVENNNGGNFGSSWNASFTAWPTVPAENTYSADIYVYATTAPTLSGVTFSQENNNNSNDNYDNLFKWYKGTISKTQSAWTGSVTLTAGSASKSLTLGTDIANNGTYYYYANGSTFTATNANYNPYAGNTFTFYVKSFTQPKLYLFYAKLSGTAEPNGAWGSDNTASTSDVNNGEADWYKVTATGYPTMKAIVHGTDQQDVSYNNSTTLTPGTYYIVYDYTNNSVSSVTTTPPAAAEPTVKIAGSWDEWANQITMTKQSAGIYTATVSNVPNNATFKFIYNNNEGSGDKWYGAAAGTTVTANNTQYDFLFDNAASNLGENITIKGTGNITFTVNFNTKKFSVTGLVAPTTYTYNVYVRNTGNDVAPTLYAFDGADYTPAGINTWNDSQIGVSGTEVTNVNALGKKWYHFTVTSTTSSLKVIAVAGSGHQTENITLPSQGTYYIAFNGEQAGTSGAGITANVMTTAPEAGLYLAGAFGGSTEWTQTAMTLSDGSYTVTKNAVNTGDEFQFVMKDGVDEVWYGGVSNDYYGVHPDLCTGITLTDGTNGNRANFRVTDGYGNLTFTVPASLDKMTITGWNETSNTFTIYVRASWAPYAHVYYTRGGSDYVVNEGFATSKVALSTTETLVDGKSWYKLTVTAPTPSISVIFTDGQQQSPTITQSNLTEYYVYNYEDNNNTQANVANNDYRLGVVPMIGKDLYLIGKANGHGWAPNNGIKMTRNGHVYTLENVQLTKASDQDGFAFASVLAESTATENWDAVVNPLRLMSHLEHGEAIGESGLGTKHSIERYHADHRNWRMDLNGRFNITVDLDNEYVIIERANEPLYMMGTYYYNGKQYSFAPNDAAEMQTTDGKVYTLSGVTLDYTVDGNDVKHGNTFQFIKALTETNDDGAYTYLRDYHLRMGANGATKIIEDKDINVELPAAKFTETEYYDYEMNTRGKFMVIVNLTDADHPTVLLRPMATGTNEMTIHLEKTANVVSPTLIAWDKLKTDPSNADFATAEGNFNHEDKVVYAGEITTPDGRSWYTWTVNNAIADFYFTRTNGSVKQSETLWRRAGNVYYTWPSLNDDDTEDETREYTYVAASGVPDCAQMLEDHYYVYFINTPGWDNVFCHAWNDNGAMLPKSDDANYAHHNDYPGVICELVGYDSEGYEVYRFDFTEYFGGNNNFTVPTGVIFNNGCDTKGDAIVRDYSTNPPTERDGLNKEQSGDFVYDNGAVYDYLGMLVTGNSLGNLIVNGIVEGPEYSIDCELEAVYFDEDAEETITVDGATHTVYGALYCKDKDDFFSTQYVEKSQIKSNEIDYMMTKTNLMEGHSRYDQSNWIKLTLSTRYFTDHNNGVEMTKDQQLALLRQYKDKVLPASSVKGQLMNNINPKMHVVDLPAIADCKAGTYSSAPNVMVTANFVGTQDCKESAYGHDGKNRYFFVTPKPYEYVHITWAVYENDAFYVPKRDYMGEGRYPQWYNEGDLDGYFKVEWDMLEQAATPVNGEVYQFDAIVTLNEATYAGNTGAGAPRRAVAHKGTAANAYDYIVKPLNISGTGAVITAVNDVNTEKAVTRVRYYNVAGVESDQPFDGVNIIVTEYNDGTKTTSKQLR